MGIRIQWAVPVIASILILGVLGLSQDAFAPPPPGKSGAVKDNIVDCPAIIPPSTPNCTGKAGLAGTYTTDPAKSFVVVRCDDAGILKVNGHLHKSTVPPPADPQILDLALSVDNSGFIFGLDIFTVNKKGNANFDGTWPAALSSGTHDVRVAINVGSVGPTVYVNTALAAGGFGASAGTAGIDVVCP